MALNSENVRENLIGRVEAPPDQHAYQHGGILVPRRIGGGLVSSTICRTRAMRSTPLDAPDPSTYVNAYGGRPAYRRRAR